jgi:hypothetical protein
MASKFWIFALLLGSLSTVARAKERVRVERPYAVKPGETVAGIARDFYRNRHFDVLILKRGWR